MRSQGALDSGKTKSSGSGGLTGLTSVGNVKKVQDVSVTTAYVWMCTMISVFMLILFFF